MVTSTRTTCRHDVRSITFQDAPPVADVLARAFADDPVVAWSIPDPSWREARSPEHFSVILDLYLPKGHVYADARLRSAALWAPPEDRQVRASQIVRLLPRLARLYRHRLPLVLAGLVRVQRIQSDEPCWYLAYLGTDPDHQGEGLAGAVLAPVLDRCDRDRFPAYLEASKPALVPYYQRYGFEVIREIRLPLGPPVWVMRRAPQQPEHG
jgi:GNAT superfamily N-acetyltransferase